MRLWEEPYLVSTTQCLQPHLENECILTFPHGNFCSISLRRLWWVCEECVREQKCASAPGWPQAEWKKERQQNDTSDTSFSRTIAPPNCILNISDKGSDCWELFTLQNSASCTPWTSLSRSLLITYAIWISKKHAAWQLLNKRQIQWNFMLKWGFRVIHIKSLWLSSFHHCQSLRRGYYMAFLLCLFMLPVE